MSEDAKGNTAPAVSAENLVTLCAWSKTVRHEGEWMTFERYLERRFGLMTTHGMSPDAMATFEFEGESAAARGSASSVGTVKDPKPLAAVKATHLLDTPAAGFDRITRLGAAALNAPATFISLVDDHRDFYLSHCGFGEPLVAAYLGVPLVLLSGEVIGAFCAIDFAPRAWTESEVLAATDLASLVVSEIELRQAALEFQRNLKRDQRCWPESSDRCPIARSLSRARSMKRCETPIR
ncbi:MAG: GAF domain-containing protein [Acidobacteriota bacterium]|nr:GAF domain-containing protein [Acidobacteriota bacterium]